MDVDTAPTQNESWTTGIRALDELWNMNNSRRIRLIKGSANLGKSELLNKIAVSIILPKKVGHLTFGGHESFVIFFSNDHKFSLSRIVHLLHQRFISAVKDYENQLLKAASAREEGSNQIPIIEKEVEVDFDQVLKNCLKRLWITYCKDPTQFRITMASLNRRIMTMLKIPSNLPNQEDSKTKLSNASYLEESDENLKQAFNSTHFTLLVDSINHFYLTESISATYNSSESVCQS